MPRQFHDAYVTSAAAVHQVLASLEFTPGKKADSERSEGCMLNHRESHTYWSKGGCSFSECEQSATHYDSHSIGFCEFHWGGLGK